MRFKFISLRLLFASTALLQAQTTPRLVNLATRAQAGTGANVLTVGFVVSAGTQSGGAPTGTMPTGGAPTGTPPSGGTFTGGAPTAGQKTVLIRAIGPSLANFGMSGVLADPVLTLINASGTVVATNDNWLATDAATMSSAGAFTLTSGSKDAAIVASLAPGAYTAQVSSADGASTGIALVEVYEVSADSSTLLNLSARANIGSGANVAIPGLVISGASGTRRLLVRAAGPALAAFGLTGVLADPTLTLTDSAGKTTYATNDNWGTPVGTNATTATTLSNAFTAAGAFGFSSGSKDSAVLVDLAPGSYTIQASGVGSTSGLALVEVYDVTNATISTTAVAPTITTQPSNISAAIGGAATLSVTATGTNPLTYQWYKSGTAVSGATSTSYTISSVAAADAGSYTVTVANSAGSVTSTAVTLSVTTASTSAQTAAVVSAAQTFYATLSSTQQTTVQKTWSLTTARQWSNLPASFVSRNGIAWVALSTAQKTAAAALISAALSATGNTLWLGLQAVDDYLAANGGGTGYGAGNYYIAFVGTPSTTSFWVLQLTGHHLTYNLAFNGTYKSPTPLFLGVEPKASFTQSGATYDPMLAQRTAMSDLVTSLANYSSATLSGTYSDLLFGANGTGGIDGTYPKSYPTGTSGRGVLYSNLSTADQAKVKAAIQSYVNTQASETANDLLATYLSDTALAQTYVAYSGTASVTTQNSYIRIDGPRVWIEFSVQRGVIFQSDIHYHSIWRDKVADYGGNF